MTDFQKEYRKRQQMREALQQMKVETASELGIDLDAVPQDTTSGQIGTYAGPVGGQMVKKMIQQAKQQLVGGKNKE
jgi:hypothetical protein